MLYHLHGIVVMILGDLAPSMDVFQRDFLSFIVKGDGQSILYCTARQFFHTH